jgi:hypothetical protein
MIGFIVYTALFLMYLAATLYAAAMNQPRRMPGWAVVGAIAGAGIWFFGLFRVAL